jgi:serine/threonine protein kinase
MSLRGLFESLLELDAGERERALAGLDGETARRLRAMLAGDLDPGVLPVSAEHLLDRLLDESDPAERWVDKAIGAFRIRKLIGEGGSASVFLADRQFESGTQVVALKVIHSGVWSPGARRRSLREQAILAQLSHPNIARLIDAGSTDQGAPFLAMEYVDGEPITQHANRRRLGLVERVQLVRTVCAAIAAAHASLIVHCDIKPSNVLIDAEGNVKVLDFGVARLLDGTTGATGATRTLAFTPEYAAPEQFHSGLPTVAVDVYAIGILLGELLTGARHRHDERTVSSRVRAGETGEPPPGMPARPMLARALRGDLDAILAKATAARPVDRYRSVASCGADIDSFLAGRPVAAHRGSLAYRGRKFVARHRVAVALSAALVLAVVLGALFAGNQARIAKAQAARADAMRDAVFDVLSESDPATPRERDVTIVSVLERALARFRAQVGTDASTRLELIGRLAVSLARQGRIDQAIDELTYAHGAARTELGPGDGVTLDLGLDLQHQLGVAARYPDARVVSNELAAHIPSSDLDRRARQLIGSATLAWRERDVDRARRDGRAALELARRAGDMDLRRSVLTAFGSVMLGIADVDAAVAAYEEVLALAEQQFGPEHEKVAVAASGLARAYRRRGDLEPAEAMIRRALAIDRAIYPGDHWITANHLNAHAQLLRLQRRLDEALAVNEEVLRISRATLPPGHFELHRAAGNVGVILLLLDRPEQAIGHLREAAAHANPAGEALVATAHFRAAYGFALGLLDRAAGTAEIEAAISTAGPHAATNPHTLATAIERRIRLALHHEDPVDAGRWLDALRTAAAVVPAPDDAWWLGRVDTLDGAVALAAGRADDARRALARAGAELATGTSSDAALPVEQALLLATAATRQRDADAAAIRNDARQRLAGLPFPPGQLKRLAAALPSP